MISPETQRKMASLLTAEGWTVHPPGELCVPRIPDNPRRRHNGSGGSEKGAHAVSMRSKSQKADLLRAMVSLRDGNADEAATKAGLLKATYWMRLSELREAGLIEPIYDNGELVMRPGRSGNPQMVCRPTRAGLDLVRSWDR